MCPKFSIVWYVLERNYLLECAVQVLDQDAPVENYDFESPEEEEVFEKTVEHIKENYFGKPRNTNEMFKDGNPNYEYQCFANINSFVLLRPYINQNREPIRQVFKQFLFTGRIISAQCWQHLVAKWVSFLSYVPGITCLWFMKVKRAKLNDTDLKKQP